MTTKEFLELNDGLLYAINLASEKVRAWGFVNLANELDKGLAALKDEMENVAEELTDEERECSSLRALVSRCKKLDKAADKAGAVLATYIRLENDDLDVHCWTRKDGGGYGETVFHEEARHITLKGGEKRVSAVMKRAEKTISDFKQSNLEKQMKKAEELRAQLAAVNKSIKKAKREEK